MKPRRGVTRYKESVNSISDRNLSSYYATQPALTNTAEHKDYCNKELDLECSAEDAAVMCNVLSSYSNKNA
jgi:hypothetical protein